MIWSARIVLVLRFHCTLATPELLCQLLQSTISTKNRTQTKLLAAYKSIMNSINTKLHVFYTKLYISMLAKIVFHLVIYKRQQFQQPSGPLIKQPNHQLEGKGLLSPQNSHCLFQNSIIVGCT